MTNESNPDPNSTQSVDDSDPRHLRDWVKFFCYFALGLTAFFLILNSGRVRTWWVHRQQQMAYIDLLTLEKGDIRLQDLGGYFNKGKLNLNVILAHELPSNRMGGVNDQQFDAEWDVAVIVDGERVHEVAWTGSPKPSLLFGSIETPRFGAMRGYLDSGAQLEINIKQDGNEILKAIQPLEEKTRGQLHRSAPSNGEMCFLPFKHPAETTLATANALLREGKIDQCIDQADDVIESCPFYAAAHLTRGKAFLKKREFRRARSDLLEAVRLSEADFDASAKLAFVLRFSEVDVESQLRAALNGKTLVAFYNYAAYEYATCPTESHRDGPQALKWAKRICEATNHANPTFLETLAVAHAECGKFAEARKATEESLGLLRKGPSRERARLTEMLKSFEANQPYRR